MYDGDNYDKRNKGLQFLRGLAMISVVIFHEQMFYPIKKLEWINQTFCLGHGVELLFLLSGYLFGLTFLERNKKDKLDSSVILSYYLNRLRRLYTPLFFWSSIILLGLPVWVEFFKIWKSPSEMVWYTVSCMALIHNLFNYLHPSSFGYMWAVSCQFQFFVIIPII